MEKLIHCIDKNNLQLAIGMQNFDVRKKYADLLLLGWEVCREEGQRWKVF